MAKLKWIGLLLVASMVAYGLGRAIIHRAHRAYLDTLGQREAEVGHWPEAFAHFYALAKLDPDYQDVDQRLAEAAAQTLDRHPEGVQDLAGNASEWVADWYNWTGYWHLPSGNPISTEPSWNHSVRGSGWFDRRGNEDLIPDLSRLRGT